MISPLTNADLDSLHSLASCASAEEIEQLEAALLPMATATPATFAQTVSRGQWRMARHLEAIDRALMETVTQPNGRLMVACPPRHGKSELCSKYLPAWFLGTNPDRRVILSSYEADFAASWSRKPRSLLEQYGQLFGQRGVRVSAKSSAANRWDIEGREGGMVTAGVGGPITGRGSDLLCIDDPVKNAEEAESQTYRDRAWDWFQSTAYTRLEPGGSVVLIQTRWHSDDLAGRILASEGTTTTGGKWRLVNFPALAEENDELGRSPGEPLWPERWPAESLDATRRSIGSRWWTSLYQQRPMPREGGMFKREWFRPERIIDAAPADMRAVVRWWDKAATEGDGDYSAGVLMGERAGVFYVLDVVRGQWGPGRRNDLISLAASLDETAWGNERLQIWMEQEGGSGGKESAEISVRELRGYRVRAERSTGTKEARADAFAAQCEAGNVRLVKGSWNTAFIDELCTFPHGTHDDQVDGASGAFNKLAKKRVSMMVG